jgi:hypothetical protein
MPQQVINIGTVAGDGTGDTLRESQRKANENFSEIYTRYAPNLGVVVPTDTPSGTGINYWECIVAGTYTNFGGVVLGANSRGTIFRNLSGVFSISQVAYDITSKVNVSDVINTLVSTETAKPLSANQGKVLNDKFNLYATDAEVAVIESDLYTAISSVASGSPKGTYANLAALQAAFPTGNTNIYLTLNDGHWYYYNSGWQDGGLYQSPLTATIKSNQSLSLAQRKDDVLHGIIDQYTGEEITLSKVIGTPTVDNIIHFQLGSEYFKRNFDNIYNPKWFGVKGDGVTDDTLALQELALKFSLDTDASSIDFKNYTYLVSKSGNGSVLRFDNLSNKSFLGDKAVFKTNDFSNGKVISNAVWDGSKVTVTTSSAHGYTTGDWACMYELNAPQMNGYYTVIVINATTYTYAPAYTPVGSFVGGKTLPQNIGKNFFWFENCENIKLKGIEFEGTILPISVQSRLGYTAIRADNGSNFDINIKGKGLAYGVFSGIYGSPVSEYGINNSNIVVKGFSIGYPVALSDCDAVEAYVDIDTCHRGGYFVGCNNLKGTIYAKNYDITGFLIGANLKNDGTHTGSENINLSLFDTGSSSFKSAGIGNITCATISGYPSASSSVFIKNINININSTDLVNNQFVDGFVFTTFDNYVYENINISGYLNRKVQTTSTGASIDVRQYTYPTLDSSTIKNLKFENLTIVNPTIFTEIQIRVSNLLSDIIAKNLYGENIKDINVFISAGSGKIRRKDAIITSGTYAPSETPKEIGEFYFDKNRNALSFSVGTDSASDWWNIGNRMRVFSNFNNPNTEIGSSYIGEKIKTVAGIIWIATEFGTTTSWKPCAYQNLTGTATPVAAVVPAFIGQEYLDTATSKWYKSTGTTNADWVALN